MHPKGGLIPRSLIERRVAGLRDYPIASEVRVYSATTGKLLRIEESGDFEELRKTKRERKDRRNHD